RYAKDEGYPPCVVFGAQSHGLGTRCLRFAPRVTPTGRQTRFPLSATLYGTGLLTRRVPMKGFHDASYIASSFPKLCLAQLRCHPLTHPRATNFVGWTSKITFHNIFRGLMLQANAVFPLIVDS